MFPFRPFHLVSLAVTLFTKAVVVLYTLFLGGAEFPGWEGGQEFLLRQRNRVLKQLTFALVTFRISGVMLERSVVSFIIFSIVVLKVLSIQVKLVKLARSLRSFNGPVRLMACITLSAAFFYLRLMVEISWALYYLVMLCRSSSVGDASVLLLGLLRLVDWN